MKHSIRVRGRMHSIVRSMLAAAVVMAGSAAMYAQSPVVTSVVNTGTFNNDEMSIDPANGDIYLTGKPAGSPYIAVSRVTGSSLTTLYATLPGTTGGDLQYTNGFAVFGANLWWNNANAGPGFATEISRAPKAGGGPITRGSPTDDLDSLSSDGTTLYTAHYLSLIHI